MTWLKVERARSDSYSASTHPSLCALIIAAAWDGDVDEYEGAEDPGHSRREVPSQQRFVETELDLGSEDGSERAYFMHQPGDLNYDDIESEVSTSEVSASDPEGLAPASGGQHSSSPGDTHDRDWDFGPTDIKFAEPVSTPSKSPEKQEPGERRPVLSRVESLSSSFMDFEMERGNNTDVDEGQAPSKQDAEHAAVPEVIDFPVAAVVDHEDVELFRQKAQHSSTSSLDVATGSLAPSTTLSEQAGGGSSTAASSKERGGGRKGEAPKVPSLLKALATGWGAHRGPSRMGVGRKRQACREVSSVRQGFLCGANGYAGWDSHIVPGPATLLRTVLGGLEANAPLAAWISNVHAARLCSTCPPHALVLPLRHTLQRQSPHSRA